MSTKSHFTTGEVADLYGIPGWKIRRVVDALDDEIPRAGRYRLVPRESLRTLTLELQRQGWLPSAPSQQPDAHPSGIEARIAADCPTVEEGCTNA